MCRALHRTADHADASQIGSVQALSLHPVDLAIFTGLIALVVGSALYARRFSRSVADYLSANRCAGRYLLTISDGIAGLGAITIIAQWEQFYEGGLAAMHWSQMLAPLTLILAMSGWVVYRFRQTRAQTLAEFLERRYSRRFRLLMGGLCFVSGVLNYGVFPAVTARFLIYFLNLPIHTLPIGPLTLNLTLGAVMGVGLLTALVVTLNGGQIAVMISDFLQGQITNVCFLLLLLVLLYLIPWGQMVQTLATAPAGESKLNPFDQRELPNFHPIYFAMLAVLTIYQYRTWQGSQAYNAAASSPHEARMANVLGVFRSLVATLLVPIAAVAAWVLFNGDLFPEATARAQATLDGLVAADQEQMARQLTTTVALKELLPVGLIGLLTAVMIMASLSTDSTYLHSWSSILVQDVINPWRQIRGGEPLPPERHLPALKKAVVGVAVFVWCFAMVFPVQEFIFMYFQATGAIFTGGAGAVIIGGLYWSRGTTAAAWASMLVGSSLAVLAVLTINIFWPWGVPRLQEALPDAAWASALPPEFWLNGLEAGFAVSITSIVIYVSVSLLTRDADAVDFDRLFHREPAGLASAAAPGVDPVKAGEPTDTPRALPRGEGPPAWQRAIGITAEFTRGDRVIFYLQILYFVWAFGIGFIGLSLIWVFGGMQTDAAWIRWWTINVVLTLVAGTITTVWFLLGGFRDVFRMFGALRSIERDAEDDGVVRARPTVPLGSSAEAAPSEASAPVS